MKKLLSFCGVLILVITVFTVIETNYKIISTKFCCAGYEGPITNCRPICSKGCLGNRDCVAPEKCECKPGFEGDDCHPICKICGKNEYCQKPGECSCNKGYKRINDSADCVPQCSKGCPEHSFCSEPEICQCEVGYARSNNTCECPNDCLDGICHEEPCVCHENSLIKCDPICKNDCRNGNCLGPDICVCHVGFRPDNSSGSINCLPICEKDCVNGNCTEPGKCTCLDGFEMTHSPNLCKPKCSQGCENGKCVAPEICQCLSGYRETSKGCQLETTTTFTLEEVFSPAAHSISNSILSNISPMFFILALIIFFLI